MNKKNKKLTDDELMEYKFKSLPKQPRLSVDIKVNSDGTAEQFIKKVPPHISEEEHKWS